MIKNSNGNTYKVLNRLGKYLLLENMTNDDNKFVVCYNYDYHKQCWQQGSYYDNFKDAKKYFLKTIKE